MKLVALGVLLVLAGCATTQNYIAKLELWKNKNISEYIINNGSPASSLDLPDGKKVYTWYQQKQYGSISQTIPLNTGLPYAPTAITTHSPGNMQWCKTDVFTDTSGIILSYRIEGNNCKAE